MNARQIFAGIAFNYLGVATTSLVGFVATPIILHHLGHSVFGEWALLAALLGYTSLLDFGIGLTVMRLVAARAHLPDRTDVNRIASTGLVLYSVLGGVVCAAGLVACLFVGPLFHVHGARQTAFTGALAIMAVILGLTFPAGLYTGINQGFGHYRQQNTIVMAQSFAGAIAGIVAVVSGGGLIGLTLAWGACVFLGFIAKALYARRAYSVAPSLRLCNRDAARALVGTSVWMFLINLAGKVSWDSDAIVVGDVLGTAAVAHYAVALGPATAVRRITDQFSSVSLTAASGFQARDQVDRLRRLLLEATRGTWLVIMPFVVLFALWGHQFLTLWVGRSLSASAPTLVILAAGMLAGSMQASAGQVLIALGRQRQIAAIAAVEAVANLALSIALAHKMGIEGVAIGTAVPTTITSVFLYIPYAARLLAVPLHRVVARLLLPGAISGSAYLVFRFGASTIHFHSLPVFMFFSACFVGALAISGILLDREERHTYLGVIDRLRHRSVGAS
jgi:O-antigen/teichoic acid export membrane protein